MAYENELLLQVLQGQQTARPPIWIMRQAGRILPGYRETRKEAGSFLALVKDPEKIAKVTIEPVEVLGVDAAILFSDILVIPEAMGTHYEIVEKKGPVFTNHVTAVSDIDTLLDGAETLPSLDYVFDSIKTTKAAINNRVPLIGFSGAPWTLFAYMIEGGGSKTFAKARRFLYEHPEASHRLMAKITKSIIAYLNEKIKAGVDVVQLFDSWAEMLPVAQYKEFSLPYVAQIFDALPVDTPKIFFPKGAWSAMPHMQDLNMQAISIDWKTPVDYVRQQLSDNMIIQGNLDPCLLYSEPQNIENKANELMQSFTGKHIMNLGHGVYPDTNYEHVQHLVRTVKNFSY